MRRRIHIFLFAVAMFVIAGYIYVSNRSANMALYEWLGIDYYNVFFEYVRAHSYELTPWMKYNLPDGLWLLSYLLAMESFWNNDTRLKWIFCIPVIIFAFMLEWCQYKSLFSGTGDILDIVFYTIAILIFLLTIKLKQMAYESN
jgi:hypothetical protein